MAKRLILVRHARIAAAYHGRLIGATDAPLDAAGEAQARAMARRVMHFLPCVVYCSPMLRCRQTAAAMAPELPLTIDPALREIDFGRWENRTFDEAAADDPSLVDRWAAFDPHFAFPNGENVGGFETCPCSRRPPGESRYADRAGGHARRRHPHDDLLLARLGARKYVAFHVPYAAIAVIDLFEGKGVLAALETLDAERL